MDSNTKEATRVFEWNKANLISTANLNKSDLNKYFAESFQVIANGRKHDANYDNYYDFLNQFRADIDKIDYSLKEFIESKNAVTIPLTANITRLSGKVEKFEAILILKFNKQGKITVWHEVYTLIETSDVVNE